MLCTLKQNIMRLVRPKNEDSFLKFIPYCCWDDTSNLTQKLH